MEHKNYCCASYYRITGVRTEDLELENWNHTYDGISENLLNVKCLTTEATCYHLSSNVSRQLSTAGIFNE